MHSRPSRAFTNSVGIASEWIVMFTLERETSLSCVFSNASFQ